MAKPLTALSVLKLKATAKRRLVPDPGTGGLKLVIQPSGAKSWLMRFRGRDGEVTKLWLGPVDLSGKDDPDKQPTIGHPLSLSAARYLAADISRRRADGIDVVAQRRADKRSQRDATNERSANTFPTAAQHFIEGHHAKKTDRRPRDWREVARMLGLDYPLGEGEPTIIKGGLCERWRDKPIVEIDGDDIFHLVEEAKTKGIPGLGRHNTGVSKARGRKMASALSGLFKWLLGKRRIKTNPCTGLGQQPTPAARDRVLNVKSDVRNADELRWFWAACDAVGQPFGPLCKLLLLTGCRLNEIARMTRDELSDDLAMLRLPGERTKNSRPYDVPLPPLAREIVSAVPVVAGCGFVFSTNAQTPVSGFSKYKARLDAVMLAIAKAERGKDATVQPWRLHDLRRTAATGMAGIGIAPHIVEAALNHVSGAKAGVAGTYNREQYEPEKRAALERWANHVAGLVLGRKAKVVPLRGRRS
jgi:integrase